MEHVQYRQEKGRLRGKSALIVGAGLGGLAAAIPLAAAGCKVTVLEANSAPGGKLARIEQNGYRFDRGPSTITLPDAFSAVFEAAGRRMEDYLSWYRIDPATRNRFADGHCVDLTSDRESMAAQIAAYSPEDARHYAAFMDEAQRLYRLSARHFLSRLMLSWRDKADPSLLNAFLRIHPFTTLQRLLGKYFRHPNTLALLGRYATYIGGSPHKVPAVFAMLAHVESYIGIYGLRGGTYELVSAFTRLAEEMGVELQYGARVERILLRDGRAVGAATSAGERFADVLVVNADMLAACRDLLPPEQRPHMTDSRIEAYEPSLSGFVVLAGVPRTYPELLHHNIYFPRHYGREFDDIFKYGRPAEEPALYICNSAYSDSDAAPAGGSNLFILANAPSLRSDNDWLEEKKLAYRDRLLQQLEERGLEGIGRRAEVLQTYTPDDLRISSSAYRGAIYGISANRWRQAFFRPANRSRDAAGLWFVGGTTHPGGGTPIVVMSGLQVANRIISGG